MSGRHEEDADGVRNGHYRLVLFTPEMLLEKKRWKMCCLEKFTHPASAQLQLMRHTLSRSGMLLYSFTSLCYHCESNLMFPISIGMRHFTESYLKLELSVAYCPKMST